LSNIPTIVVLAAGLGSRYGSLKQIDRFGPGGETIIDYSVYDAVRVGFKKVVFIIRRNIEPEFKEVFVGKFKGKAEIDYVFQELDVLPKGVRCPADRIKPWGTGHAVLTAAEKVTGPFAVINADDFYGAKSFGILYEQLSDMDSDKLEACLVAYKLKNTLSVHGGVSRGICSLTKHNELLEVTERTHIQKEKDNRIFYTEKDEKHLLSGEELVSMNLMGFTPPFFEILNNGFKRFLKNNIDKPHAEYFLPDSVSEMLKEYSVKMPVIETPERTYGVTYQEDKPVVQKALMKLTEEGVYPNKLWD
jgi:UTP-glucose-1-phosphate uridylyltransferase